MAALEKSIKNKKIERETTSITFNNYLRYLCEEINAI